MYIVFAIVFTSILYITFNTFSKAYRNETKLEFWLNSCLVFFILTIAYADLWGTLFVKIFELGFDPLKILSEYAAIVFIFILSVKSQIKSACAKAVLLTITPILSLFAMSVIKSFVY
jgi:hypothetical protein